MRPPGLCFGDFTKLKRKTNLVEVGGIEPPTRVVAQELTGHCDQIVTLFFSPLVDNVDFTFGGLRHLRLFVRLNCARRIESPIS